MDMRKRKAIVEAALESEYERQALGIMNTDQALGLEDADGLVFSHPDKEAGVTDHFVDQDQLRRLMQSSKSPLPGL
jgi:predicted TIM-barrel enzyme